MTTNVKLEDFSLELDKIVEDYGVVVASNLGDVVEEIAESFRQDIPTEMAVVGLKRFPKHRHHLADSWVCTDISNSPVRKVVRIHAVNGKGRIVHLLENSHQTKGNTIFQGRHFLQHLLEKYRPIMDRKVKETIANGDGK